MARYILLLFRTIHRTRSTRQLSLLLPLCQTGQQVWLSTHSAQPRLAVFADLNSRGKTYIHSHVYAFFFTATPVLWQSESSSWLIVNCDSCCLTAFQEGWTTPLHYEIVKILIGSGAKTDYRLWNRCESFYKFYYPHRCSLCSEISIWYAPQAVSKVMEYEPVKSTSTAIWRKVQLSASGSCTFQDGATANM